MRTRLAIALSAAVLFAPVASAGTDAWTKCDSSSSSSVVGGGGCISYSLNSSSSTGATSFTVKGVSALGCINTDTTATANGATRADLQLCVQGVAASANTCTSIVGSDLDGTGGSDAAQNMCVRIGPGLYRVDFTAIPASGEEATFWVEGEE